MKTIETKYRTNYSKSPVLEIKTNWCWNGGYANKDREKNYFTIFVAFTNCGNIYRIVKEGEFHESNLITLEISDFSEKMINEFNTYLGSFTNNYLLLKLDYIQKYELEFNYNRYVNTPLYKCDVNKYWEVCEIRELHKKLDNKRYEISRLQNKYNVLLEFIRIYTNKKFGVKVETIEKRIAKYLTIK